MENVKEKFLQLAYTFYPKGISDEDAAHRKTPEFQHLIRTLQEHNYLDNNWKKLLDILQQQFQCLDIGVPDPTVRDYRIALVIDEPAHHYIVINISKLIPYYCFYTHSGLKDLRFSEPGYFIFSGFIPSDQEIVEAVKLEIEKHFEGYKELPPDLLLVEMQDVEFEESGILLSEKYRNYFQPMTLFKAFFSTHMFY